ncbi:hypothetical protein [Nocardia wallacei]|uniref:hypothetical protein n=1 Tax=Nocardia wallacei TaxID=480035 RepID=UPI0024556464|nr:hypothetical protein [Nocardia wallacei]
MGFLGLSGKDWAVLGTAVATSFVPGGVFIAPIATGLVGGAITLGQTGSWKEAGQAAIGDAFGNLGGGLLGRGASRLIGAGVSRVSGNAGREYTEWATADIALGRTERAINQTLAHGVGSWFGSTFMSHNFNNGQPPPIPAAIPTRPAGQDKAKIPFDKEQAELQGKGSPTVGKYEGGYSQWPLENVV